MIRGKIIPVTIICLLITIFAGQTLSQFQRPRRRSTMMTGRRPQRPSRADRKAMIEQAKKEAEEQAIKEALRATRQQWNKILPGLRKVSELRKQARLAPEIKEAAWITTKKTIKYKDGPVTTQERIYEDWSWKKSWDQKTKLTPQEKACEDLIALLDSENATDVQKKEKMDALRRARKEAGKELAKAQEQLSEALTPRQKAVMFMMGWLD